MPPETKEDIHYHTKASQFFFIIKGEAVFHTDSQEITVSAQEGIIIEPQTIHFIENKSLTTIDFLVVSQPTTNNDRTLVDK